MSVSTDGILYWGIELGDEFNGDYDEINYKWREKYGPKQPEDKGDYKTPEWDAWREIFKEWEKTPENIEINFHCSGEYSMYYVSVERHHYCAYRGYPIEIDPSRLVVTDEDREMLNKFIEFGHIAYAGEPQWTLCSLWI